MINCVRSTAKSSGIKLTKCESACFTKRVRQQLPPQLLAQLRPLLKLIDNVNKQIDAITDQVEKRAKKSGPVQAITQIQGVGVLTAETFVHTLDDPSRFKRSRDVGAYLGLTPKRDQSGGHDPQLSITKAGDVYLRSLLVNCAHYILGPFGPPSDLRSHGERIAKDGNKNAKKRAVIAVARKLAVVMHRLWVTGEEYQAVGYAKTLPQAA